jgi:hypothetical protein
MLEFRVFGKAEKPKRRDFRCLESDAFQKTQLGEAQELCS